MTRKTKYLITILSIILIVNCIMIPVMAKYYKNKKNNIAIEASEFYFTSDLLDVEATNGSFPEYTNAKGSNVITFNLNNYEDDLRITTVDIEYKIVLENIGNVEGAATSIKDYLPEDMTFDINKNKNSLKDVS